MRRPFFMISMIIALGLLAATIPDRPADEEPGSTTAAPVKVSAELPAGESGACESGKRVVLVSSTSPQDPCPSSSMAGVDWRNFDSDECLETSPVGQLAHVEPCDGTFAQSWVTYHVVGNNYAIIDANGKCLSYNYSYAGVHAYLGNCVAGYPTYQRWEFIYFDFPFSSWAFRNNAANKCLKQSGSYAIVATCDYHNPQIWY